MIVPLEKDYKCEFVDTSSIVNSVKLTVLQENDGLNDKINQSLEKLLEKEILERSTVSTDHDSTKLVAEVAEKLEKLSSGQTGKLYIFLNFLNIYVRIVKNLYTGSRWRATVVTQT